MLVGERAAAAVALEDLAFDGVRDVTRTRGLALFDRGASRLAALGEALSATAVSPWTGQVQEP
jgi:hypothetical protein